MEEIASSKSDRVSWLVDGRRRKSIKVKILRSYSRISVSSNNKLKYRFLII